MAERSHLSIGEVLSLLREEFPDVTISKIRFLESQGLVDPERTPSGYRKFYDHDVERLRWILRQQRENFLPLKIIRGRLTEHGDEIEEAAGGGETAGAGEPDAGEPRAGESSAGESSAGESSAGESTAGGPSAGAQNGTPDRTEAAAAQPAAPPALPTSGRGRPATIETASAGHPSASSRHRGVGSPPTPATTPAPVAARVGAVPPPAAPAGPSGRPGPAAPSSREPALPHQGRPAAPSPSRSASPERDRPRSLADTQPALGEEVETFSAEELADAAGGTPAMVKDLQQYGLITARSVVAGTPYYDAAALYVAKAAAGFSHHGVEARHLRAWRNAADREAGIFEQVIMPLLRQRNPEARRQAAATLSELASLGGDLRQALIDQALRQIR